MKSFIVITGFGDIQKVAHQKFQHCKEVGGNPISILTIGGVTTHPKILAQDSRRIFSERDRTGTQFFVTNSEAAIFAITLQALIEDSDNEVLFIYVDEAEKEHEITIDSEGFLRPYPKGFCDIVNDLVIDKIKLRVKRIESLKKTSI